MSTVLLHPLPPTLPASYCIGSGVAGLQDFVNTIIGGTTVPLDISTATFFNFGSSVPAVNNRAYPWLRWSATNPELNGWFVYDATYGYWVRPNPEVASSPTRRIWMGSTTELETYDGGEAGAPLDYSGQMWEVDTDFQARFPLGVGTLPISGTVVAVGGTGGLEKVTLTIATMPSHTHTTEWAAYNGQHQNGPQPAGIYPVVTGFGNTDLPTTGGDEAHDNMPPYKAVYYIKRTARIHYRLGP